MQEFLTEKQAHELLVSVSSPDVESRRKSICALEDHLHTQEQVPIPVIHAFAGDIYSREITIKKGTTLIGRIHKFDHFDVMISGDIMVSTDTGGTVRLKGSHNLIGKAGKKRAGYAFEDTRWITFHSAQERNPEEMYEFLTCGSYEEYEESKILIELAMSKIAKEEEDFKKSLQHSLDSRGAE